MYLPHSVYWPIKVSCFLPIFAQHVIRRTGPSDKKCAWPGQHITESHGQYLHKVFLTKNCWVRIIKPPGSITYWQGPRCLWLNGGMFSDDDLFLASLSSAQLSPLSDDSTLFTLLGKLILWWSSRVIFSWQPASSHLLFLSPFFLSYSSDRPHSLKPQ